MLKQLPCQQCGTHFDENHRHFKGLLANHIARLGSELESLRLQETSLVKRKFSKNFRQKWEEDEVLRKIITDKISVTESELQELRAVNEKFYKHTSLDK